MKDTLKIAGCWMVVAGLTLALLVGCCSCGRSLEVQQGQGKKIKAVVITGGHGFKEEPFFAVFETYPDIDYVELRQEEHSEAFEDISALDCDVIVLYNMTQEISPKRQRNFTALLERGVGLVAMHHSIGAFQQWGEYGRIIGGKYYLNEMEEDGVAHPKSEYTHDVDVAVHIEDEGHPITRGMSDFVIFDETYRKCVFQEDNHVLLSTNHPGSDGPLVWVRRHGKARVCYFQLGHGPEAYANENYRQLLGRAIRWSAGRLN